MEIFKFKLLILERPNEPTSNEPLLVFYELEDHLLYLMGSNNNLIKSLSVSALAVLRKS